MKKQVKIIVRVILCAALIMSLIGCDPESGDNTGGTTVSADLIGTWRTDIHAFSSGIKGYNEYIFTTNTFEAIEVITEPSSSGNPIGRESFGVYTVTSTDSNVLERTIHLSYENEENISEPYSESFTFTNNNKIAFNYDDRIFTKQ